MHAVEQSGLGGLGRIDRDVEQLGMARHLDLELMQFLVGPQGFQKTLTQLLETFTVFDGELERKSVDRAPDVEIRLLGQLIQLVHSRLRLQIPAITGSGGLRSIGRTSHCTSRSAL